MKNKAKFERYWRLMAEVSVRQLYITFRHESKRPGSVSAGSDNSFALIMPNMETSVCGKLQRVLIMLTKNSGGVRN